MRWVGKDLEDSVLDMTLMTSSTSALAELKLFQYTHIGILRSKNKITVFKSHSVWIGKVAGGGGVVSSDGLGGTRVPLAVARQ